MVRCPSEREGCGKPVRQTDKPYHSSLLEYKNLIITITMKKNVLLFLILAMAYLMTSCNKEDESLNIPSPITISVGEVYNLRISKNWVSSMPFVATVQSECLLVGNHVGECTISCEKDVFTVVVEPRISLYRDPITQWGMSKIQIINREGSNYTEISTGDITYNTGNDIAPRIGYIFKNGGLYSVWVPLVASYKDRAVNHLKERYRYIGFEDNTYYFADGNSAEDATTAVELRYYDNEYWQILYFPY